MPRSSIIIRTKNEERWISHCLEAIISQTYQDYEIVIVDNNSTDGTVEKATQYPVKIVTLDEYTPGKSLNLGIENSEGEFLVFISGHCIPVDDHWLKNLVKELEDESVAGVYGRQQPMSFSTPEVKRELIITFGLDKIVQHKDSFFHNANSAIRRTVWEKHPFDNHVTNIEDRIWASHAIADGYKLVYTPDASVYHHHGIHQNMNKERAESTLKVLESISNESFDFNKYEGRLYPDKLKVISLIPFKGTSLMYRGVPLLGNTIKYSLNSKYINETILLTDNEEVADFGRNLGAKVPFIRESEYSKDYVDLSMMYSHYIEELEKLGIFSDLVVSMEPSYIYRPENLVDNMILLLLENGYDSIVPVVKEYNYAWVTTKEGRKRVDNGDVPREMKDPLLISMKGIGLVTHPEFLREGRLLGNRCGTIEIEKKYSLFEVRNKSDLETLESLTEAAFD